ncbi:protein AMEIOTIC 1 homolog isoform X2 [Miscanthus floridulus]|uniref:protein AMEIOTIC 1 homolog isoform X2 n=1 Tax=Miscanthus floridulus TaxID=154761 RepID=UPI003459236B
MTMSACGGGGGGAGGISPASRFLRRRAAVRDLGGDVAGDPDSDAFWAAAPLLYDFSQQQPTPQRPARRSPSPAQTSPCLLARKRHKERSPSPPPAPRRSPASGGTTTTCLLSALHRTCVGWGVTRRAEYPSRYRPASPTASRLGMRVHQLAASRCVGEDKDKESTSGAVKRSKCLGVVVGKNEQQEEDQVAPAVGQDQESGREEARKARSRKRARWSRRRRSASRRAKKAPRVVKEEQEETSGEASAEEDVKPAVAEEEPREGRKRAAATASARARVAAKRGKRTTPPKQEEEKGEVAAAAAAAESKPATATPDPGSPRGKVDRWSAWRYAAGEATLVDILRERGATAGNPAPRADLRAQARRHIGDTGLLDHLLRHVADKVPAGSADRVRRRYNPAGGLEYWLEPAGLAAVRREAGVDDPYWVPPPGWKHGDPVSPEARTLQVQKQVEELTVELAVVKRQMKQLDSNLVQVSKEAYISWKGYDCMMKANGKLEKEVLSLEEKYENAAQVNGELKELLLLLKDKYDTVLEKNEKLEGQMVALSTSFQSMKEELLLQRIEEQPVLMLAQEPWDGDKQEACANNALVCASNQLTDADAVDGSFSSDHSACDDEKMALRKGICMREGAWQWPRSAASGGKAGSPGDLPEPLTPGADLVIADFDTMINSLAPPSMEDYLLADGLPTPTSASSTNASPKLQLLPSPASPIQVQPLPSTAMVMGDLNLQLRHSDMSSTSSGPCGAKALNLDAGAGGGEVDTELVLATPTY